MCTRDRETDKERDSERRGSDVHKGEGVGVRRVGVGREGVGVGREGVGVRRVGVRREGVGVRRVGVRRGVGASASSCHSTTLTYYLSVPYL